MKNPMICRFPCFFGLLPLSRPPSLPVRTLKAGKYARDVIEALANYEGK